MKKNIRAFDRQIAFQELANIFSEQSKDFNESRLAVRMRFFGERYNIPSKKIFLFNRKMLRPLFYVRNKRVIW